MANQSWYPQINFPNSQMRNVSYGMNTPEAIFIDQQRKNQQKQQQQQEMLKSILTLASLFGGSTGGIQGGVGGLNTGVQNTPYGLANTWSPYQAGYGGVWGSGNLPQFPVAPSNYYLGGR